MDPRNPRMYQQSSPKYRPPSNVGYFAEQSRRASYMGPEVHHIQHEHFRDPHNHHQYHLLPHPHPRQVHIIPHPRPHIHPHSAPPIPLNAHAAIQREIEKQIIREEIIRSELARRSELEAEVRRELMVDRELARQRNQLGSEEHQSEQNQALPFQRGPAEPKISEVKPVIEEIVLLAKSDANSSGSKRKVDEPTPDPISHKKAREEWSCALCKVSANSEEGLNEHLQGKKHKHKESVLRAEWASNSGTIGFGISSKKAIKKVEVDNGVKVVTDGVTPEKMISKNSNSDVLQNQTEVPKLQTEDCKKKNYKYWCEMCKVGSHSKKIMDAHEHGKRHVRRFQENRLKNVIIVNHAEGTENGKKIVAECFTLEKVCSDNSNIIQIQTKVPEPQNGVKKKRFRFRCEMCQVGARNKTVLENHEKGKRHLRCLEEIHQQNITVRNHVEVVGENVILENAKASSEVKTIMEESEGTSDMMKVKDYYEAVHSFSTPLMLSNPMPRLCWTETELTDENKAKLDKDMEIENDSEQ